MTADWSASRQTGVPRVRRTATAMEGTARRKGDAGNWGDPPKHEGRAFDAVSDGDAGGSRTGS